VDVEPLSAELIERYLDSRGLRFYRSRDGKGLLMLFSTEDGKLQVNLRVSGKRSDVLVISISTGTYHRAADRSRLMDVVNDWNRDTYWPKAFVRETSQPGRIAVVGESAFPLADGIQFDALGNFINASIRTGAELFAKVARATSVPSVRTLEEWLDRTG
jgi:Putative bacterial sensory transduction regulator